MGIIKSILKGIGIVILICVFCVVAWFILKLGVIAICIVLGLIVVVILGWLLLIILGFIMGSIKLLFDKL
jgi:hypothetical protein